MEGLRRDMMVAARSLLRAPAFTVAAVLTLALGIGANSAFFSVLDAVVLRPLPLPHPDRFVHLTWDYGQGPTAALTPIQFEYWRDNTRSFKAVATYKSFLGRVEAGDHVNGVTSLQVSRGFLDVLGFEPALGRDLSPEENVPDGPRVALVSQQVWQDYLGGTSDAVGRTLRVNEEPYTVVGVLPPTFAFPHVSEPVGIIVPMGLRADPKDEGQNYTVLARLRDGISLEAANEDAHRLLAAFAASYPNQVNENGRGITVTRYADAVVGDLAGALWMAMASVFLVLLIACANVANLILARSAQRRREIALRAALGASNGRIVRLVLAEGLVLAVTAGALGLLLAYLGVSLVVPLSPVQLPRMAAISVDWRVAGFTLITALGTGVLFGAVGTWPALHADLAETMKDGARGSSGRSLGRQSLLAAQACLSMILLVGAGLFLASLRALRNVDAGFQQEGVVTIRFPFKPAGYGTNEALWDFQTRMLAELRRNERVEAASASNLPLERGLNIPMSIGGRPDDFEGAIQWRAVSPGYFTTLGIKLVAGRAFGPTDEPGAPHVAIINEAFARRYFPDMSPLGQRIDVGRYRGEFIHPSLEGPGAEIVGVVADVREVSLRSEASRTVFVPAAQAPTLLSTALGQMPVFMVRGATSGSTNEGALRALVRRVDPGLPDPEILSMDRVVAESLAQERFATSLFSTFATLAVVLTAMGIYGVLAYTVRQRRREIGVRIALGADSGDVMRLVGRNGMIPVAGGLVVGLLVALSLSHLLAGMLWGVSPTDPTTLVGVVVVLLAVTAAAAWLPAREALRVDPVQSLGAE